MSVWTDVLLLTLLIIFNGFFAMSEIAIVASRRSKLQLLAEDDVPGAKLALKLSENPSKVLSIVQIGMTSIAVLSGVVGQAALVGPLSEFIQSFGLPEATATGISLVVVVFAITYFSIVIGELVPKRIGQLGTDSIARIIARPITWISYIISPFVKLLEVSTNLVLKLLGVDLSEKPITEEEIQSIIEEGSEVGVIPPQEHSMVKNVFRLDDRAIVSLMIPRSEVEYIDLQDSDKVNLNKILQSPFSSLPVCDGSLDDVKGAVTNRLLLKQMVETGEVDFKQGYEPVVYVPESLTGMELLENFRKSGSQLAMVVDEYGDVLGLVTSHDVLEAIAGEFTAQAPSDAQIITKGENCYEVDGLLPIPELKDLLDISEVPDEGDYHYTTTAGMVIFLLEKLPALNDHVEWEGWEFKVVGMDGRRLDRILITKLPQ